ncbi:hypothetical protein [Enhygromyxa salina]|nr:hypothetical protein [Enhygromyxa salina]
MQRAPAPPASRRSTRASAFALVVGLASVAIAGATGCSRDKLARDGRVSQAQADQYVRNAVRQSSEGVVLEPSQKGLDQIERVRLAEIAQDLRGPAAICFLDRAIVTMEPGQVDGEQTWLGVPEGQAKFRARVAVDGAVLTADVLESGFDDKHMDACLTEVISKQRFVESRDTFAYYIDVYYWVSLGFFAEAGSDEFAELMRRQQTAAAVRAKACLTGRVGPGEYRVQGLNLFDRDGRSVINRVERGELPEEVSTCVAAAFKQIRIHAEADAFIRPAAPDVVFTVAADGSVGVADERWLELIELEERAARDKRKSELLEQPIGVDETVEDDAFVDEGEPPLPLTVLPGPELEGPEPEPEPEQPKPAPDAKPKPKPKPDPNADPSKPGTKLDLSPRRRN